MCVCMNQLNKCKTSLGFRFEFYNHMKGDWSRFAHAVQRSCGISADEWSDQPLVPVIFTSMASRLSQEPPSRFQTTLIFPGFCNLNNFIQGLWHDLFSQHAERAWGFLRKPVQSFQVTELFFARKIHSTSQIAMTTLSKCVTHVGSARWHEPLPV